MLTKRPNDYDTILYRVRPGDSLGKIIQGYYGSITTTQRKTIISQILADNPDVKDPHRIFPNQLLKITIPQLYCTAESHPGDVPALDIDEQYAKLVQQQWQNAGTPQEKDMLSTLTPIMLGTGAASLTMVERTFKANTPLLTEMVQNYQAYKAGDLSKGKYDYRRKKIVNRLNSRLGLLSRILSGSRTQSEVLRISIKKGRKPTRNISRQIGRMGRLSKYASRGGVVLSAVGIGFACNEIANTDDKQKKNEILVEALGGLAGGLAIGAAIVVMASPVGWIGALVVGASTAIAGFASGKGSQILYTAKFSRFDIASATRVTQVCKK